MGCVNCKKADGVEDPNKVLRVIMVDSKVIKDA